MARWEDALSEKHRIATWWLTDMGQAYGRNFHADVVRKDRPGRAAYVDIAGREAAKLKGADPVWVSDEVMDLVEAAADHESFRFEPIHAEDLFAESGFALLPRGRYQTDVNGLTVSFRAFSWGPDWRRWAELDGETGAEPALSVTLYTDWHDDIYLGSEEARPAYEDLVADRADALVRGNDPRDLMPGAREQQGRAWRRSFGSDLSMFHSAFIPWGTLPSEILDEEIELNVADEDAVRHAVLGLWLAYSPTTTACWSSSCAGPRTRSTGPGSRTSIGRSAGSSAGTGATSGTRRSRSTAKSGSRRTSRGLTTSPWSCTATASTSSSGKRKDHHVPRSRR
jgi:hypothetical protein